jgi:peptide/nickel transport system permease protein
MTDVAAPVSLRLTSPRRREWLRLWGRARRSTGVLVGTAVLSILVLAAVMAPLLSSFDPIEMTPKIRLQPPSPEHVFGTDQFGRDIFTRTLYGGRISLQVGIVSVALAAVVGTTLGLVCAYYRGRVDTVIMRFIDVLMAFPNLLLALAIVAFLGRSLPNVMIAVGVATIPIFTRIVRGSALSVQQMDYVLAAQVNGCKAGQVMFSHVLPNVFAPLIVIATNSIAGALIAGAALSFLGLGVQAPTAEWGIMLSEGQPLLRSAWWVTTFPGLAIMIAVMAINLMGDGLRDVLDPRLKL